MSEPVIFLDGRVRLYAGDCIRVLAELEADSVHAIVTDPPYGLEFMGKGCMKAWNSPPARYSGPRCDVRPNTLSRPASASPGEALGRWPANLVHDGSEEVLAAFPRTASGTGAISKATASGHRGNAYGAESRPAGTPNVEYGDEGSAARFFYTAKADSNDRVGSKHPTVKPVKLMRWLCRLVTPKGGTILDPFAGTGTTGEAAFYEGFDAILIEREADYQADIARRMELVLAGPAERKRAIGKVKARPDDAAGPLFEGPPS